MRRLFVRVFLAIWLASALIGVAIALVDALGRAPAEASTEDRIARRLLAVEGEALLAAAPPERAARLDGLSEQTGLSVAWIDASGAVVHGDPDAPARAHARRVAADPDAVAREQRVTLTGARLSDGSVLVGARPARPTWARALATDTFALRGVIVLLVSALIALVLARHLTGPIERLRVGTARVADGDLSVRVGPSIGAAPAEIEALAEDFDAMVARVEALLASRGRLLSDVSHELGSPLSRLRVAVELARSKAGPDAGPMLDRIEIEAERLGALADEILLFERLEGGVEPARERVDLRAVLGSIAADAAFERDVDVRVHAEDLVVSAAPALLRRAIENVVRNAVRHAPEGTDVEITAARDGEGVVVAVRDHGPGVPDADLERIFEPLVRLDRARDHATGGRGLGLAIARRAIEHHGGTVIATPAHPGLRVTLTLGPRELGDVLQVHVT